MKFCMYFTLLIVMLAVSCVGLHLYVVESEMNQIRDVSDYNLKMRAVVADATRCVTFAENSQYVAVLAEERASVLAYKMDLAASVMTTLEEQLDITLQVVEDQCLQLKDLIDQNSDLQNENQRYEYQMETLRRELEATKKELEALTHLEGVEPINVEF